MAKLAIVKNSTNIIVYILVRDSSSTVGAGLTGLLFNSAGLTCYYVRPQGAATQITLATQTVTGTHSDGGFVEVDATNMPGIYRLDLPDIVFSTGIYSTGDFAVIMLKGATNMEPVALEIQLTSFDLNDASPEVTLASETHTGAVIPTVTTVTNQVSADVTAVSGDSVAADNLELDYDGTGYTKANSTIGTTTTNTDMRGTDNAALASVLGALSDAAAAGDPTAADTVMQYVKQLVNVLVGTTGVTTFPAEAAPANNVSLSEVVRAIHADVTGLNGDVMRGTDNAALASVLGALTDAAAAGDPTTVDTVMQYVKQLVNVLVGTTGITTFPVEAAPANNVSLSEVIRAIHTDVTGLNGDAMRGTDSAALASDYTSARAGYLDNINGHTAQTGDNFVRLGAPAGASVSADIAAIQTDTDDIQTRLPAALVTGTADSGSTTTMVDAARTEADTDYWKGNIIRFTSGNISGQSALITAFTPASDTITFYPAVTQTVIAQDYEILPHAPTDIFSVSGDSTAADNLELDYDGTGYTKTNSTMGTVTTLTGHTAQTGDNFARLGAPAGASVSADIAAIPDASEINAEVVDVLKTDTISEMAQQAPPATPTFEEAVMYLYMALRNKIDVTSSLKEFHNDAGTVIWKKTLTDDATTYSEAEGVTGP